MPSNRNRNPNSPEIINRDFVLEIVNYLLGKDQNTLFAQDLAAGNFFKFLNLAMEKLKVIELIREIEYVSKIVEKITTLIIAIKHHRDIKHHTVDEQWEDEDLKVLTNNLTELVNDLHKHAAESTELDPADLTILNKKIDILDEKLGSIIKLLEPNAGNSRKRTKNI